MSDVTPPNSAAGDQFDSHMDPGQIRLRRDVAENQLGLLRLCAICGRTASMVAQVSLDLPRLPANKRSSKPDARNRGADWCVGTGCDAGCAAGCSGLPELGAMEGPGCVIAIGVAFVLWFSWYLCG